MNLWGDIDMFISEVIKLYEDNIQEIIEALKKKSLKKLKFIFYEEDIYIDTIYIPKVKRAWLDNVITHNLVCSFEDISNLSFSYEIISKKNKKYKIMLYCINSKKNILYNSISSRQQVVGVYLIQHCYHYFVKKALKVKNFILVFDSNNYTYIISSSEGFLKNSLLYNRKEMPVIIESLNKMLNDFNNKGEQVPIIITLNYEKANLLMEGLSNYCFKNMGTVNESKIIRKYTGVF